MLVISLIVWNHVFPAIAKSLFTIFAYICCKLLVAASRRQSRKQTNKEAGKDFSKTHLGFHNSKLTRLGNYGPFLQACVKSYKVPHALIIHRPLIKNLRKTRRGVYLIHGFTVNDHSLQANQ